MAQFRVGCVPYVNARPLVAAFDQPNEFVEVVFDVPSKLPELLDKGEVDAILVSSIELLRRDDLIPVADVGIMSFGPVQSVRLLAKVPLLEIRTLALDQSSMTSNKLAQVILAEKGVFPVTNVMPPSAQDMLAKCDACVIIGDKGFEADGTGLVDIDLGAAWTEMTGLPFVWALWLGKKEAKLDGHFLYTLLNLAYGASGFSSLHMQIDRKRGMVEKGIEKPDYEARLQQWADATAPRRQFVCETAAKISGWTLSDVETYLSFGVRYQSSKRLKALERFRELLNEHRLCETVEPEPTYFELKEYVFGLIPSGEASNS